MQVSDQQLSYYAYVYSNAGSSYHRVARIDLKTDQALPHLNFNSTARPERLLSYLSPDFYSDFLPAVFYPERANQIIDSEKGPVTVDGEPITGPTYIPLSGPVEALQQQVGETGEVYNVAARSELDRNLFYYSDNSRHVIYRVIASKDHELLDFSIFAGSPAQAGLVDGTGSAARFYAPSGLSLDAAGNLFVSDTGNHAIRKITPAGEVSTFYRETQPYVPRFSDD
ncbi:MAG: hypothetical protein IGS03_02765 [Candidatus Sericytochromatia bacterium]|nr:hypothetical protein [Candidatus Sericytochromatia bacterium]